jgi:hypothetical protein
MKTDRSAPAPAPVARITFAFVNCENVDGVGEGGSVFVVRDDGASRSADTAHCGSASGTSTGTGSGVIAGTGEGDRDGIGDMSSRWTRSRWLAELARL